VAQRRVAWLVLQSVIQGPVPRSAAGWDLAPVRSSVTNSKAKKIEITSRIGRFVDNKAILSVSKARSTG
jgi:hypothetical protein